MTRKSTMSGIVISAPDRLPRRLSPLKANATLEDLIKANNETVKAVNELAIETQLCRLSIQDVGTKLGELSEHIRDALHTVIPSQEKAGK